MNTALAPTFTLARPSSPPLIHRVQQRLFKLWRVQRHALFLKRVNPRQRDLMLDVGGYPTYWKNFPHLVARIDCVNLHAFPWDRNAIPQHKIRTLVGNGCSLGMADNTYDIAFSNSVIEHVGDLPAQQAFARELTRVGRRLWVQTPAYECPLEPHFMAPFIHWLPRKWRIAVARNFTFWGLSTRPSAQRVEEFVDFTRLMTKKEFAACFPGCRIITERMLFFIPKSYIAVRDQEATR